MSQSHAPAAHDEHDHDTLAHALPMRVLVTVFVILLALTFITVAVTWVDLGPMNIWVAMVIAAVKAAIVGLYFMHLRYDSPFNSIILIASLLFVTLFIGASIVDTSEYLHQLVAPESATQGTP